MFIATLLTIRKLENNQDEWIKKLWYIKAKKYYSVLKKKKRAIKPSRDKEYSFIHISKWMKLSWKAYILHESNHNTFQEKRNIWEKKKREIWGQWNKLCFPAVRVMGLMNRWSQVTFSSVTLPDIIKVDPCHCISVKTNRMHNTKSEH